MIWVRVSALGGFLRGDRWPGLVSTIAGLLGGLCSLGVSAIAGLLGGHYSLG